ncbi:MAG: UDP-2,3-diacylglucosamine diphosphatase [Bacteroidales bacterium]|nr:UDP-2,3-diacylglucosamine diphosphatase [Bacteroidales bacterium]
MSSSNVHTKIYFVSDAHLGFPNHSESLKREKLLVQWLNEIKNDATEIYLLGDIFDFWFEYKRVVPKGFTRFFGKIAEITDNGIPVHFFTGNHDLWIFDYLPSEIGIIVHRDREIREINGKRLFIAHGDGLGPSDAGFKVLKKIFKNKTAQWLFARIHPNFAVRMAIRWSQHNRYNENPQQQTFLGKEKERLIQYAYRKLEQQHYDFFIFGHRHIPIYLKLNDKSTFINLGDWLNHFTYAVFDGKDVTLKSYNNDEKQFYHY